MFRARHGLLTVETMASLSSEVYARMAKIEAFGPDRGLELLRTLENDARVTRLHRLHAVRAHLLELAGDTDAAVAEYDVAARLTTSLPEQRYLQERASRLRSQS